MKRNSSAGPTAVLIVLAGCAAAAGCRGEAMNETSTTAPAATIESRDDTAVKTAVQAKFYTEDLTRGRAIDVSAQDGAVTLRGTVPTEAARQRAVTLARSVDGVTNVDDKLTVTNTTAAAQSAEAATSTGTTGREPVGGEPAEPAWITTKIQAQYFLDPDIKPWAIDVTTGTGGVVKLEGTVDSADDKADAVRIARETDGVTRVDDRLRIEAAPDPARPAGSPTATPARPDAWITAKVQAKYFVDDQVKARNIDVTTQNAVVQLRGTVASEAERRQAVALARNTDGVREVTDQLRVDPAEATRTPVAGALREVPALDRPDSWITMKVQAKYFLDADVKGHKIDVDTRSGVVTLKGTVNNTRQKQEAELIARQTEGVKQVVNQLVVGTTGAE